MFLRSRHTSLSVSMAISPLIVDQNLQECTALAETILGKPAMMGPCLQSHKAVFVLSVESCSHFHPLQPQQFSQQ